MQIKQFLARALGLKAQGYNNPNFNAGLLSFGNPFSWIKGLNNSITGYDNKIVYSGMNKLVSKLVEVPRIVSKIESRSALKSYYKTTKPNKLIISKAQALTEQENHPLNLILDRPNSYQTGIELMDAFWHNWLFGDGFLIAMPKDGDPGADNRNFKPAEFHSINRNRVTPQSGNGRFNKIDYYLINLVSGEQIKVYPDQVFHMKRWNPDDDMNGYAVMNAAGKTVSKDEAGELAQGAAFVNGGRGTLFSSETSTSNDGDIIEHMSAEQMKALKDTMRSDYAGAHNNRKMHYTNGKVIAQSYGDTLAEMELSEVGKANWRDIYAVLDIPIVLGPTADAMTESNVVAGYKAMVTNTVVPYLRRFDQKFNQWISLWYGADIVANHDITEFSELTPDYKLLKEVYGDAEYLTENEKRKLFNFDTDESTPGMNTYWRSTNKLPIADLMNSGDDDELSDDAKSKYSDYRD